ncbi:transcription factor IIF subunit tfg1 [Rhizina undulata]
MASPNIPSPFPVSTDIFSPQSVSTAAPPADNPPPPPPRLIARRKYNTNPFVQRARKGQPRPPRARPVPNNPSSTPSTAAGTSSGEIKKPAVKEEWAEYPLVTTKASLLAGLSHHIIRMHSKREVKLTDELEFARPVRLHRRDPSAPLGGAKLDKSAAMDAKVVGKELDENTMKMRARFAEKHAKRAANLAKIAPYGQRQKKDTTFKPTQQVFHANEEVRKLRNEEYLPWFIEDFENKNTWQGNLEGGLSGGAYAMLSLSEAGKFKMVMLNKYYKFTENNKFRILTTEEAELEMKKKSRPPRWLMERTQEKQREAMQATENARHQKAMLTRKGDRLEGLLPKSEMADADDLDFEDDRFADDEEAPIMDGLYEENKEIEKRIKKEQLSANVFDTRGEKEYEEEEAEKRRIEAIRHKLGKKIRKSLKSYEGNHMYDSDSDKDPYGSEEEEVDEETEAIMAQERKKEEARKQAEAEKEAKEAREKKAREKQIKGKGVGPSSVETAQSDTQSKSAPVKQGKAMAQKQNVKRAGSDDASTLENHSKKKRNTGKAPTSPIHGQNKNAMPKGPGGNQARSPSPSMLTPAPQAKGTSRKRKSDVDASAATATEDGQTAGDMSGGPGAAKKQRVARLAAGKQALSPTGASGTVVRQTSAGGNTAAGVSRTASPATPASHLSAHITDDEIRSAIPPDGCTFASLAGIFGPRIKTKLAKNALVESLKRLTDTRDRRMYLK